MTLEEVNQKLTELEELFYKHKHIGLDKTQTLGGSFAKGQATLSAGHVVVTDAKCTVNSRIIACHDTSVSPTLVGVINTQANSGTFDIYSWKENTNATIQTSDNGLIDYVIFY